MPHRLNRTVILTLAINANSDVPLFRQLYDGLRTAILNGRISPGTRLPSTRALAEELGVARNTVLNAYQQLLAEGYLDGKVGSGTFVPEELPEDVLHVPGDRRRRSSPKAEPTRRLSQRGQRIDATKQILLCRDGPPRAFRPGMPALSEFPFPIWHRLLQRHARRPTHDLLCYGDPLGWRPLREALAQYLATARGVRCEPDQVIIVAGSQQALALTATILLDPGDAVLMEDPGYAGGRAAFLGAGAEVVPVPLDKDGLDIAAGQARRPSARLAYVTPSHQYPLGVTMSLSRRLALLDWAHRVGGWIMEDDYDSEYRYAGRPLASLQGLDPHGRVIYTGTFSKVLFPSLRLGYLVVPPDLVSAFISARQLIDFHTAPIFQAVLADFIQEGHFVRHIRRMRTLYAERQSLLVKALQTHCGDLLRVRPTDAGMQLLAWLPDESDDRALAESALRIGLELYPLSSFCVEAKPGAGFLLGFSSYDPRQIDESARRVSEFLRAQARESLTT